MTGQLAPFHMTAKPIDTGFFEPPSVGMPNPFSGGGGGSPFSGIEGLLMNYAMADSVDSAKQNAQQKVSGVMSGIQSLISESFPNFKGMDSSAPSVNFGGGMSTTGQLGFGGGSNSITQPTSPAPFTPAISPSDMGYPAPKIGTMGGMGNFGSDLSHIITNKGGDLMGGGGDQSTNDFLTPEQKEQFGITTTNYQGPVSLPVMGPNSNSQTYMGGVPVGATPNQGLIPNYVPKSGFGGDPDAPQIDYTPDQMMSFFGGKPMVGGSGMGNPMALSGPPATPTTGPAPTTGPPAGFEKTKGLKDVGTSWTQNGQDYTKQINPFTGQPEVLMVDDIQKQQLLEGKNIFAPPIEAPPSMEPAPMGPPSILQAPDPNNPLFTPPMTLPKMDFEPVSATLDPAMEYNLQAPLPQQNPLINLMYNYNMENSPY